MLSYIKKYRKIKGGKWYKVRNKIGIIFYTTNKPNDIYKTILKKYKY